MNAKLSKAEEVLDPQRARDFKAERDRRAREREEALRETLNVLFGVPEFEEFLDVMVISFGYWRFPNHVISEYDQGRRAMIHEFVERLIACGGQPAEDWFADSADRFARWLSEERKMKG